MIKISPSLLASDFFRLEKEIDKIEKSGADLIHIDVMDGHFVPNLSFCFPILDSLRDKTKIPFDVHLMVTNPEDYVERLSKYNVEYISVHQETCFHLHRILYQIKEKGIKAGVAINPATSVSAVEDVIDDLDFILLMSVNPGFGGQEFIPNVYEKIKKIRKMNSKKNLEIEVDGGVTNKNSKKLIESGVDILVAGSYIFKQSDYYEAVRSLKCLEI